MRPTFIQAQKDHYRSGGSRPAIRTDAGLFWWTIFITLLAALATFCWFFSIYLFSHPEKPFNYQLLTKLDKITPVKAFTSSSVPSGTFRGAKDLYEQFYEFTPSHLRVRNTLLKRNYLQNYREEQPVYLRGTFEITEARPLGSDDVFPTGLLVIGLSADYPNVTVEYILPGAESDVSALEVGSALEISGSGHHAAIVHIERFVDERICLSAVSLTYSDLKAGEDVVIQQVAPTQLNLEGSWPIGSGRRGASEEQVAAKIDDSDAPL